MTRQELQQRCFKTRANAEHAFLLWAEAEDRYFQPTWESELSFNYSPTDHSGIYVYIAKMGRYWKVQLDIDQDEQDMQ